MELERRAQPPAVRGEIPSELAEAVLEAANRIAAALPPGVQLQLHFQDSSDLGFIPVDQSKALVIPGRLDVYLEVSARAGYFDGWVGPQELEATAEAMLFDGDADGQLDTIALRCITLSCTGRASAY